jgi:ATP-dependent Clp protease ATP-binding subunit ClpA
MGRSEHLLAGLLAQRSDVVTAILTKLEVDLVALPLPPLPSESAVVDQSSVPWATEVKTIFEKAEREASERNYSGVGAEHLLLGILRIPGSGAAAMLRLADGTDEEVRAASWRLVGPDPTDAPDWSAVEVLDRRSGAFGVLIGYWHLGFAVVIAWWLLRGRS